MIPLYIISFNTLVKWARTYGFFAISIEDLHNPDCMLGFYDTVLIFDHHTNKVYIAANGFPEQDERLRQRRAERRIEELTALLSMIMIIYFNGRLISADELVVSPLDHGFLYGHGLFETMRAYNGKVFKEEAHFKRLAEAAAVLGWPELPSQAELTAAISSVLQHNDLQDASIRLTLSRGSGAARPDAASCGALTIAIFAAPLPPPLPPEGWSIATVKLHRNVSSPLVRIKSANYLDNILAKAEAKLLGAQEAVMLNTDGFVAEGSMSNIFLVKAGRLITPDESSGILPGITRSTVIELAQAQGIPTEIRKVKVEELDRADEIFLTSSIMEVIPVRSINNHTVGNNVVIPGIITTKLREVYRKIVVE